jgi:hypothetical protein
MIEETREVTNRVLLKGSNEKNEIAASRLDRGFQITRSPDDPTCPGLPWITRSVLMSLRFAALGLRQQGTVSS